MIKYLKYKIKNFLNFNKRQLGEIQIELSKKNYKEIKNIRDAEVKVFSQFGEDGIINFLLDKLNINDKINFVEIGTGDYEEANTRFLCESRICKGLLIDKLEDLKFVQKRDYFWKNDLYFFQKEVTPSNISSVIKNYGFDNHLNLLSIDIDGNDYWVLKNIDLRSTDIVVAEYNPLFGSTLHLTIPQEDLFDRNKYNKLFYGASLPAIIELFKSKEYFFVGANRACNNAFFIHKKNKDIFLDTKVEELREYTNFTFRELKKNSFKENQISNLVSLIENFEIYDLKKKQITKVKEIKKILINDR
tara:strand:+ start:10500 stop:11408 length:909 start_codon:yes stop_codon:yes gene_type:complete